MSLNASGESNISGGPNASYDLSDNDKSNDLDKLQLDVIVGMFGIEGGRLFWKKF